MTDPIWRPRPDGAGHSGRERDRAALRPAVRYPAVRIGLLADTVDHPGGIGRYTRELLGALARRGDVRLVVAAPEAAAASVARLGGDALDAHLSMPSSQLVGGWWARNAGGRKLRAAGAELVHGTKHLVPRGPLPTVLTVHDVLTITRARDNSLMKRLVLPAQYRHSLSDADRLVAVSRATRDRLAELDPAWGAKTVVVPSGVSHDLFEAEPTEIPGLTDFALVVGDVIPRKNLGLLLDCWPDVAARGGPQLVVVGKVGPHGEPVAAALTRLAALGFATWVQGADDGRLRWCYEHARVVLLPSLEEGFGLPLVEARAFGAPVIASTDAALVEVAAGDPAVTHLDPHDSGAWRDAVLASPSRLHAGSVAIPSDRYSWDDHAAGVVAVYRDVLGR